MFSCLLVTHCSGVSSPISERSWGWQPRASLPHLWCPFHVKAPLPGAVLGHPDCRPLYSLMPLSQGRWSGIFDWQVWKEKLDSPFLPFSLGSQLPIEACFLPCSSGSSVYMRPTLNTHPRPPLLRRQHGQLCCDSVSSLFSTGTNCFISVSSLTHRYKPHPPIYQ